MSRKIPALVAVLASVAAALSAPAAEAPSPSLTFDLYHAALLSVRRPSYLQFEYTQTRSSNSGRVRVEQHRVFRASDGRERNDTIMVNGTRVVPPISRIMRRPIWPYDLDQFAASTDDYGVAPAGVAVVAGRRTYGFTLARKTPADFALKGLYVDVRRFLPVREAFSVTGGTCSGAGAIDFGPLAAYWLPISVQVSCAIASGPGSAVPPRVFKESIRFSNFHFPASIPADVLMAKSSADAASAPEP